MWKYIIIAIIVLIVLYVLVVYNKLISLNNKVKEAFSTMDVYLKKRWDLIPNLVESVKGYMAHEEGVLTKVTELRTAWANASTVGKKAELDSELSGALKTIMAVSENYPDLKADRNFSELQEELRSTEDKIAYARQFYNDSVTMYNTKLETIPTNIIASMFNFKAEELFQAASDEARQNVKVDFSK